MSWKPALFEGLIAAYLAQVFLSFQRRILWGGLLAMLVLGGALAAAMVKYQLLQSSAQFSDLFLLDDLFLYYSLSGDWHWLTLIAVLALLAIGFLANFRLPTLPECILLLPLAGLCTVIVTKIEAPAFAERHFAVHIHGHSWFPEAAVLGHWEAFFRSAIHYADREARIADLRQRVSPAGGFLTTELAAPDPRNVHVILLESFYDPMEIKGLALSADPFAPLFKAWRARGSTHAVSPVYGDRSPDAEFELLCGLPATLDSSQIIYSQITASSIDCLPNKLRRLGWSTESWVPVIPALFGSDAAYRRMGLAQNKFSIDLDMSDRDGEALSAQALLQQNLKKFKEQGAQEKPAFNYIFTTAGHFPFALNTRRRPMIVDVTPQDGLVAGFVNNIAYTTRAVDAYVQDLQQVDPDAIILILGDHPPPLPPHSGGMNYPAPMPDKYNVPLIVINGRNGPVALPPQVPTYHLPYVVADLLTRGRFCRSNDCPTDKNTAVRPLAEGVLTIGRRTGQAILCHDDLPKEEVAACREANLLSDSYKLTLYGMTERDFGLNLAGSSAAAGP